MASVIVEIPEDILDSARLTVPELKLEIAVALYAQGKLSLGKARELADMSVWEFRQVLGVRRIPPHVRPEDVDADAATLRGLKRI